jgi:ATP-dependent Clp protease adaptor protein ClpS
MIHTYRKKVSKMSGKEKTDVAVKTRTKPRTQIPPQYRVILHNDDVNEMGYVVETIVKLTPIKPEQAFEKMMEAHETGAVLLLVCHKERAELYEEQFRSCHLIVTIEPD